QCLCLFFTHLPIGHPPVGRHDILVQGWATLIGVGVHKISELISGSRVCVPTSISTHAVRAGPSLLGALSSQSRP
uniref:Uncharacterized protein n=1 Tax=Oncorhynchus mykiss TaxID=8022 RepID=A0A8C7LKT3_ONCMY